MFKLVTFFFLFKPNNVTKRECASNDTREYNNDGKQKLIKIFLHLVKEITPMIDFEHLKH